MIMRTLTRILVLLLLVLASGCTSMHREYPGHNDKTVWQVMQAVAREPKQTDWFMIENSVWVDEANKRIEIYRFSRRDRHDPGAQPRRDDRRWRFQVVLDHANPPRVKFVSRGFGVPAHAWEEANLYFDEVGSLLPVEASIAPGPDTAPTAVTSVPAAESTAPAPPSQPAELIDPDTLRLDGD